MVTASEIYTGGAINKETNEARKNLILDKANDNDCLNNILFSYNGTSKDEDYNIKLVNTISIMADEIEGGRQPDMFYMITNNIIGNAVYHALLIAAIIALIVYIFYALIKVIKDKLKRFEGAIVMIEKSWDIIKNVVERTINSIKNVIQNIKNFIKNINWKKLLTDGLKAIGGTIVGGAKSLF